MDKKIQFTPVRGFVLVKPLSDEQPKQYIIEDSHETPHEAEVVAVGEDTWYESIDREFKAPCKKGEKIVHSAFGFETIRIGGEEYRLVPFSKVLAIKK